MPGALLMLACLPLVPELLAVQQAPELWVRVRKVPAQVWLVSARARCPPARALVPRVLRPVRKQGWRQLPWQQQAWQPAPRGQGRRRPLAHRWRRLAG